MKTNFKNAITLFSFLICGNILFAQNYQPVKTTLPVIPSRSPKEMDKLNNHQQNNLFANTFLTSPNDSCYLIYGNALYLREGYYGDIWDRIDQEINTISIDPLNPKIFYAISTRNQVSKSMNGGGKWILIQNGLPSNLKFNKIFINPHNNSEIFLTSTNGIYKTTNAGFMWQPVKLGIDVTQFMINSIDKNKFYALSPSGIFFSKDAGQTWKIISNTLPKILVKGTGRTANYRTIKTYRILNVNYPTSQFFLAFTKKGIFKTNNDGKTWFKINNGIPASAKVLSIFLTDDEILFGGKKFDEKTKTWKPLLYKSDIFATKWQNIEIKSNAIKEITGIYKDHEHPGIFINSQNRIAYIDTSLNVIGLNFGVLPHSKVLAMASALVNGVQRLYCYVENNNYTDIENRALYYSTNNGKSWIKSLVFEETDNIKEPNIYVSPIDNKVIRIIGSNEYANGYFTNDGGDTWSGFNLRLTSANDFVSDFVYDPVDKNIIYSCNGVNEFWLFRYEFNPMSKDNKWMPMNVKASELLVNPEDNKRLLTNFLNLSTDGGWTWNSIKSNINIILNYNYRDGLAKLLYYKRRTILLAISNDLVISYDEGNSWKILKSFNGGIKYSYINPNDFNNIIVIIKHYGDASLSGLTVEQTSDGLNWKEISMVQVPKGTADWKVDNYLDYFKGAIIINKADKKTIYLYGNMGMLHSNDNGKTWQ